MTEIDREHFCNCNGRYGQDRYCCNKDGGGTVSAKYCLARQCGYRYHKWPTPEQFEEEYGRSAEGMPFWAYRHWDDDWCLFPDTYSAAECVIHQWELDGETSSIPIEEIVVACTPYGKPPANWRPGQ